MNLKLIWLCLKAMRAAYRTEGRRMFDMPFFLEACPGAESDTITDALSLLAESGIVRIFYADDIAYETTYNPDKESKLFLARVLSALKFILGHLFDLVRL
ncbi:MAG: hypothetical protein IKE76_05010 [Clostridia bacterium]|nr:hypothetical protein [Clostridia bacterium]